MNVREYPQSEHFNSPANICFGALWHDLILRDNTSCAKSHVFWEIIGSCIVAQLISAVRVSKDYVIEIDFRISERELGLGLEQEQEIEIKPKAKKRKSEPVL